MVISGAFTVKNTFIPATLILLAPSIEKLSPMLGSLSFVSPSSSKPSKISISIFIFCPIGVFVLNLITPFPTEAIALVNEKSSPHTNNKK